MKKLSYALFALILLNACVKNESVSSITDPCHSLYGDDTGVLVLENTWISQTAQEHAYTQVVIHRVGVFEKKLHKVCKYRDQNEVYYVFEKGVYQQELLEELQYLVYNCEGSMIDLLYQENGKYITSNIDSPLKKQAIEIIEGVTLCEEYQ